MPERAVDRPHFNSEFWTMLITMVVGGLAYSIISFSYMHATFTTRTEVEAQVRAQDKYEESVKDRLQRIENKLDAVIEGRRR